MVQTIIETVGDFITGMFAWVTSGVTAGTEIFYNETTGLTLIGTLALMGLAVGIVYFVINFIRGFVQK